MKTSENQIIGQGWIKNKLYLLNAKVELPAPGTEKVNFAIISKPIWDQWHR
jgi:hypothetical protein